MNDGLKSAIKCIGITLVAICGAAAMAAAPPTTEPADLPHSSLIAEVAKLLQVTPGKHNPLPELEKVATNFNPNHLDEFVNALCDADFTSIHDAVLAHTTVLEPKSAVQLGDMPDWSYGSYQARQGLRELMWTQAKKIAKTDPKKGKAYARAAILFYAMDEFRVGPYGFKAFLADKDGLLVAGIDEAQATKLLGTVDARTSGPTPSTPAEKALDRLFKHPQPEEFQKAVDALQAWLKSQPDESDQFEFAESARQLFNHAVASGDKKIQLDVNDALSMWKKTATGAFRKWLDEASSPASDPKRMYDLSIWKDGRWVETDTDGNPLL